MSRRTADASKAIRLAWEKEQQRVLEGKGTRDWTKKQQQDIIDRGKAYDEDGKAFVGQHMKNVSTYPEYQGEPDNIQFLTYQEHFEAHKRNWHNPTNWYYNPDTKEYVNFREDEIIPCKVIELSNPISICNIATDTTDEKCIDSSSEKEEKDDNLSRSIIDDTPPKNTDGQKRVAKETSQAETILNKTTKRENVFVRGLRGLKSVGIYIFNHPEESRQIVKTATNCIRGFVNAVSSISSNWSRNNNAVSKNSTTSSASPISPNIATQAADNIEKTTRAENDVSPHKQRYHYKDGSTKWVDKSPYHRGGKNE